MMVAKDIMRHGDPSAARVQAFPFTWHRGEIVAAA